MYYQRQDLKRVLTNFQQPLNLQTIAKKKSAHGDNGLVIKDMPYQIGDYFLQFAEMVTSPVIFLMRDPRLNIASRIAKKMETGASVDFPLIETGWQLVQEQIRLCRVFGIPHMLVDATEFRNHPEAIFPQVFERLNLSFTKDMLTWNPHPNLEIDNLGGDHSHLYKRALGSTGIQPATEFVPALEDFPERNGFRQHVAFCLAIYQNLSRLPERVHVAPKPQSTNFSASRIPAFSV